MTLLRITPARLSAYQECPRRYYLHYVAKATPDPTPRAHLSLGTTVHLALARWWDLPRETRASIELRRRCRQQEPDAKAWAVAAELVAGAWQPDGYRDDGQSAYWQAEATDWTARYLLSHMPAGQPAGVERSLAFVRGDIAYDGQADRIDVDPFAGAMVVDYKTGRYPPSVDEANGSLALAIYCYGAWKTFHAPCTTAELHHVPTGEVVKAHRDEEWLRRLILRADAVAAEIRLHTETVEAGGPVDGLFPPVPGPLCGSCPVRPHCPAGRDRPGEEPWAVLDRWVAGGDDSSRGREHA